MDKTTAAREAAPDLTSTSRSLLPASPSNLVSAASDWYSSSVLPVTSYAGAVDWTDVSDVRTRRHSLPTVPQGLASTSHESPASSFTLPFPSLPSTSSDIASTSKVEAQTNGLSALAKKKSTGKSKLRQTLSVIGEGSTVLSGHSRESTYTIRGAPDGDQENVEGGDGDAHDDDDDTTTERDSVHSRNAPEEDATIQLDPSQSRSGSKLVDGGEILDHEASNNPQNPSHEEPSQNTSGSSEESQAVV